MCLYLACGLFRGLIFPPIPERLPLQIFIIALTSVPFGFPFAGCTTNPFGLFTTIISPSSYKTSKGISSASIFVSFGGLFSISNLSPCSYFV